MAQWELKYGSNAQLLNISQSIIKSQTEEIRKMQNYLLLIPGCTPDSAPSSGMVSVISTVYATCKQAVGWSQRSAISPDVLSCAVG